MNEYRILKEGEMIEAGDEVDVSNSLHKAPKWVKTSFAGDTAPDPTYPAHRMYRRKIANPPLDLTRNGRGCV